MTLKHKNGAIFWVTL